MYYLKDSFIVDFFREKTFLKYVFNIEKYDFKFFSEN